MPIKHGVYIYERDTAISVPITANTAQVVVGAAPVWMLDDPAEVTNKPVLCTSAVEAMEKLGYVDDFAHYGLCQTMYITSNLFQVAPVVYINVLDVATHKKAAETVTVTAPVSSSVVIDKDAAIKSSVTVSQESEALVKGIDYTVEYNDSGKLVINFVPGSGFDASKGVSVGLTCADPSAITSAQVVGSYNPSTGAVSGAELINFIYPRFGVVPGLLLAPGFSQVPTVGLALAAKAANINGVFRAFAVVDIDTAQATTYSGIQTVKQNSGFASPFMCCVWPSFKVGDYVFAGSAILAALTAYTEAQAGGVPSRSPSNKLLGVSGTCLADGTEVVLTQDQGTIVNSYGVITAINLNGWRSFGSYTAAYPGSTEVRDIWVPVRRMFNWQANNFILTYFDKVDDPLNEVLVESVVDSENIRCGAYTPDVWAGAEIQYLAADNPETDLLAGKVTFRQSIAPYTPAQEIECVLSYNVTALREAMLGQ